ncbi:major facilitator superfamily domain-containing protein [Coniochaeta sp. 2T2.1]|nr:major facilitator superfamily domain-containing protein [Coniochaeta sp. 2T2.1]
MPSIRSSGEDTSGTTDGATACGDDPERLAPLDNNTLGGVTHSQPDSQFADQDPENPRNWPPWKKWTNIITISVISFVVPLVSAMLAPAVELVMQDFNTSSTAFATLVVSIFVLGFACGALLLPPLSELYGCVLIYHITNVLFLAFTIVCALARNESMLLVFRFLSGFAGVATITIGSGSIADLMPREKRGKAVSIWSVGTILGPMVGPIIGGYVTEVSGWRSMFWFVSIAVGIITIFAFAVLGETYPPVLLKKKEARLYRRMLRPLEMLLCCPIVTVMCAYVAVLYGTLYLLFSTYSFVFREVYSFSTFAVGLVFLPGGVGTVAGLVYVGNLSDKNLRAHAAAGKPINPETRLPLVIILPGALSFPVGLFIYGWTVEAHVHWAVPLIGTAITGFGSILVFIAVQTYLIDAFEEYAASVIGANAVLRGVAGALLPLGGLNMYTSLGWGWGNSVLGFIALLLVPVPWVISSYGHRLRALRINHVNL